MKLTPTMKEALARMADKLKYRSRVFSEPNENTGRALLKRGLIEVVGKSGGWNLYVLTDAGRQVLAEESE
nr:MAG TPA: Transcriptional regulator PadR-like family [Caudoviricetes sp.]